MEQEARWNGDKVRLAIGRKAGIIEETERHTRRSFEAPIIVPMQLLTVMASVPACCINSLNTTGQQEGLGQNSGLVSIETPFCFRIWRLRRCTV
jgi:hypothetical protein